MTVSELHQRMSLSELLDWCEHDSTWHNDGWIQFAVLAKLLSKSKKVTVKDFLPKLKKPKRTLVEQWQALCKQATIIKGADGGK